MLSLFRALTERLKALFMTDAAAEFECELVTRAAERQADLMRQADRYAEEGLHGIADHLRRRAEEIDLRRPLAGVLPALEHLQTTLPHGDDVPPRLRLFPGDPAETKASPTSPTTKKRGGKT